MEAGLVKPLPSWARIGCLIVPVTERGKQWFLHSEQKPHHGLVNKIEHCPGIAVHVVMYSKDGRAFGSLNFWHKFRGVSWDDEDWETLVSLRPTAWARLGLDDLV